MDRTRTRVTGFATATGAVLLVGHGGELDVLEPGPRAAVVDEFPLVERSRARGLTGGVRSPR